MGTLPSIVSEFSPDKLPFGRMVQLSITAPTIGGYANVDPENPDYSVAGIYGPCPIGSLPLLIDTFVNVSDPYSGDNDSYAGSTFTETNEPWQFHPQSPVFQPYLVDPNTAPWDSTRRIQYWNKVEYDYSTVNSATGLSGTGPRLLNNTSDGQIIVTAPEDRPVPYVAWLTLSLNVFWDTYGVTGYFTGETDGLSNIAGPTVGIVRHSNPADNVNYRLIACQEVTNFYIGDLLTTDFYQSVDEDHSAHYQLAISNNVHTYNKKFVSLFAFDVVPPNESYIVHAGWQHPNKNDWIITTIPRDQALGAAGIGAWTYTAGAPTFLNSDGTQWDAPMNRFGVMTF